MKKFLLLLLCLELAGCATYTLSLQPLSQEHYEKLVTFKKVTNKIYPPTTLKELEVYKNINHYRGLEDKIIVDKTPERPYETVGVLEVTKGWHYSTILNYNLKKKVEEVGGDAILEYETFQSGTARVLRQDTGKVENVFLMNVKATVIKFTE